VSQGRRQTRKERALAAQRERERKQRLRLGGIIFAVIALLGLLFWLGNRPKAVDVAAPTGADRTAWGPADAPVVIEEWSDFN
jgi:ferric-dicitrate binding protein FerR (iron transport regulator)